MPDTIESPEDIHNRAHINSEVWRSNKSLERFSLYNLRREEKYLFPKYFYPGSSILDLACGAGRTTLCLHELGYKVKGVDFSDTLINAAKKRFPYLLFEEGSYCAINEPDESYDNVLISFNSLDYAYPETEREKALSECARVLKSGGYFIMSSHNIKSLNWALLPWTSHKWFLLKNMFNAFLPKKYLYEPYTGTWTFFASTKYVIQQTQKHGVVFKEMTGVRPSSGETLNKYFSPHISYVFQKAGEKGNIDRSPQFRL
jgi:ubiquinone/menaquinone biosynthesis C-methylase UbiE